MTLPESGLPRLAAILRRLRDPVAGCPWDIAQTHASLAPYAIEEAHEVADAIAREAWDELPGELGDLLLQPVFQAQVAAEAGRFDIDDVLAAICDKLVARHPHIFGDAPGAKPATAADQTAAWEATKAAERGPAGALDGVAQGLPALMRAAKLQARAARVGFDWPSIDPVVAKVAEEAAELAAAKGAADTAEEYGDLLFVMANLGRHLGLDPEAALQAANAKFARRFKAVEAALAARGRTPAQSDLAEMDALWDDAKAAERLT